MIRLLPKQFKILIFISLIGFFASFFPLLTKAYLLPGVAVQELKINGIKNGGIDGTFSINSNEDYYIDGLYYEIQLFRGTNFGSLELIDANIPEKMFVINPKETITKSFVYAYPENITDGDYTLTIHILTDKGDSLGWAKQIIPLKGKNNFLDVINDSSRVLVEGKEAGALQGVSVSPEEKVTGFLKIKNSGNTITVIPHIKVFQRLTNMPVVKEYQDSPITFAKEETKEVSLIMPKFDIPESYLAEVKFYQNDQQVSGIQYFRWIVKGSNGKILYIKTDKDSYKTGESISLIIDSIGPADFSNIGTGKLEITVYDNAGKIVATVSQDILMNSNVTSTNISIPVKKDLVSPTIDVKLIKDKNILDNSSINLSNFSQSKDARDLAAKIAISKQHRKKIIICLVILIILVLFLSAGFFLHRKMNHKI